MYTLHHRTIWHKFQPKQKEGVAGRCLVLSQLDIILHKLLVFLKLSIKLTGRKRIKQCLRAHPSPIQTQSFIKYLGRSAQHFEKRFSREEINSEDMRLLFQQIGYKSKA